MIGDIYTHTPVSAYQPSREVEDLTCDVQKDYSIGDEILNKQYVELNYRSVIDDENNGQLMFNAFVDDTVDDPNEEWKYRGTRSMARNKGIAMHATLTANYLLPLFAAQNEDDEVDRDFSEFMRDVIEWMAQPNVSNYQSSFFQIVFGMMHNPVTYLGAEFFEVYQKYLEEQADGTYTKKEMLDRVLSGFQAPIYSSSQILITNAYERNIQKQRRIIKRRWCEKSELEGKYGTHPNWQYVQAGYKTVYSAEEGVFYDVKDDLHENLVAEEIALCRQDDSEAPFVGGIYMGNMDNVEWNPIKHRDQFNAPKYNIVPFGYYRIGEHFFYYKSMMNTLRWDNNLYDAMSEVVMNKAFLEMDPPVAVTGSDKIDSEMNFPSAVISFEDKDTKVQRVMPPSDFAAGFNALRETEKSINEGSVNETTSGQLPDASQKAYNVAQAQAASKTIIKGVGRSLAESVALYGDLMKDIAVTHITLPEVEELVGENMRLKYPTFIIPNKNLGGKYGTKTIKLDSSLLGMEATDEDMEKMHVALYEKSSQNDSNQALSRINPELIRKFNYLARTDVEEMFARNQEYWQPVLLNLKQALINDQYTNQEALTKELMYSHFQSRGDKFVQTPKPVDPTAVSAAGGAAGSNQFGQNVKSQQLAGAANAALGQ